MPACPKSPPLRDEAYRKRAQRMPCDVPTCYMHGESGEVMLCHINIAGNFGRSMKAGDDQSFYLCSAHHAEMDLHSRQRDRWIVQNIVIPQQQARYQRWRIGVAR